MDKEDAILAFKRHATSKIFDQHSLFYIESLGLEEKHYHQLVPFQS